MKDPHKVFCVRREVPAFVVGAVTVVVPALKHKLFNPFVLT